MGSIEFNGEKIEYVLNRKKVKNINLRIRADGSVVLSAPRRVPISVINDFVRANAQRIIAARERFASAEQSRIRFESGDRIYILGREYFLSVENSGKDHYALHGRTVTFYLKDSSNAAARSKLYDRMLSDTAKRIFPALVRDCLPLFPQKSGDPPQIKVRKMRSQWGNCRALKNVVTLNSRLAAYDENIIRFVICHELCHFEHQNHSKNFYNSLSSVMPQWKEYDRVLKNQLNYC